MASEKLSWKIARELIHTKYYQNSKQKQFYKQNFLIHLIIFTLFNVTILSINSNLYSDLIIRILLVIFWILFDIWNIFVMQLFLIKYIKSTKLNQLSFKIGILLLDEVEKLYVDTVQEAVEHLLKGGDLEHFNFTSEEKAFIFSSVFCNQSYLKI